MDTRIPLAAFLAASVVAAAFRIAPPAEVPYPDGYRHWAHVKSAISAAKSDGDPRAGIHHIYANRLALEGYERGRFPEGSVIVFDLLAVTTVNGTTREGARKLVDVMHKDSMRFAGTGGWGFEEFRGDTRVRVIGDRARTVCFQCHTQRRDHDFVFSSVRP